MRRCLAHLAVAALLFTGCDSAETAIAPVREDTDEGPTYRVRSLAGPAALSSVARALNDAGQVVGALGGIATRWTVDSDGDASAPLPLLLPTGEPATASEALATNASGLIVGRMGLDPVLPFVWSETGGVRPLPLPEGLASGVAYDLNDGGVIIGGGAETPEFHWRDGGRILLWIVDAAGSVEEVRDLGSFGSSGALGHGVSAHGEIVGVRADGGGALESFVWSDGLLRALPAGGEALAVNDQGTVVGTWSDRAARWTTAGLEWVGPPGSVAHGLNNDGVVVGEVRGGGDVQRGIGFVFQAGVSLPLEALSGIDGARARAINSQGLIVGESYVPGIGVSEAVVWVPG